ncbi:MAG: thiosulfate oxidation carrier protein SoxY [Hyphomicrobiaceae bacterium]|nr:thiosulfate oxidation carrier protein SoxY [Hyphomicrobiaceae bacterium]
MTTDRKVHLTISVLNRRSLLITGGAAMFLHPLLAAAQEAPPQAMERSKIFEEAYAMLTAGGTPLEGKVTLELPEIAENGNFVPVTITVDSPMTPEDYVKTIHLLSTANPVARVASFHLSPINGVAKVQSRMRLAKTQDVIALAVLSNGTLAVGSSTVKVTIGGCSS